MHDGNRRLVAKKGGRKEGDWAQDLKLVRVHGLVVQDRMVHGRILMIFQLENSNSIDI